jgi:hypothetical protein
MMYRRFYLALMALGCAVRWLGLWTVTTQAQSAAPGTFAGPCSIWTSVSDGAFGMDTGGDPGYNQEEGFEVAVFDGQLYVGMEADNVYGARLWRTKAGVSVPGTQADWEEVAADGDGYPFGNPNTAQDDHIDSLGIFHGVLYASTANRTGYNLGTRVYTSTSGDPGTWISVISPGFGDVDNVNFKDMVVFDVDGIDWLCGGTMNETTGAQVWCTSDGATWAQKNASGFGVISNTLIASTGVFSAALYVGVVNVDGGSVWRTADLVAWTRVFTSAGLPRVEVAGAFDGHITIAAGASDGRNGDDPAMRLYRSPTGDPGSWNEIGHAISADAHNTRTIVDGATVYNGALYVATMNTATGAEVWRTTDGVTWAQVNIDGFGDAGTFAAELVAFNGYLYAWTSNYVTGQRVYRIQCVWPYRIWLPLVNR